jgi:hypothetical protein
MRRDQEQAKVEIRRWNRRAFADDRGIGVARAEALSDLVGRIVVVGDPAQMRGGDSDGRGKGGMGLPGSAHRRDAR